MNPASILTVYLLLLPVLLPAAGLPHGLGMAQTAPQAQPAPSQTAAPTVCPPSAGANPAPPCKAPSHKPPHRKRIAQKVEPAGSEPVKTVVHNGGTTDSTLEFSPSVSEKQASQQLANTKRLLVATDANLDKIAGRTLDPNQQESLSQIKSYEKLAKSAIDAGDFERAQKLAVKANLLSTEMVAH